jgi:hypothetical protein
MSRYRIHFQSIIQDVHLNHDVAVEAGRMLLMP